MEIAPGVHSLPVTNSTFMGVYAPNVYLVGRSEAALIDTGYADEAAVKDRLGQMAALGLRPEPVEGRSAGGGAPRPPGFGSLLPSPPRGLGQSPSALAYIVITHHHPDHVGGAALFKEKTGAQIALHRLEAPLAQGLLGEPSQVRLLEDGETLEIGGFHLRVIHAPGHSPGLICLFLEEERILFTGDNVLGSGTTAIGPPLGDMAQYIDSLRKLLGCDAKLLCPGHGPVVKEPRRKLEELIQHRLEREGQVLALLGQGKGTVKAMVAEIYPELDGRLYQMAQAQVLAHLIKLEREGRVQAVVQGGERAYRLLPSKGL